MKVLWISNIVFPEALSLLKGEGALKSSGGWLIGAAETLVKFHGIDLTVAAVSKDVSRLTRLEGQRITYYLLPYGKGNTRPNRDYEPMWRQVRDAVAPDVVHIHGTEFSHGLAFLSACGNKGVCVSIQGLVSAYYPYYCGGIPLKEICLSATPASLLRGGILRGRRSFKRRGECEKEIIRRTDHIIGRTSWDRARTWAIHPQAEYHHGGETLREEFYTGERWSYDGCRRHSLFLSQADYPIKGLHMVLKALPLIRNFYPDVQVRIAGTNTIRGNRLIERLKMSDYGRIVRKRIKEYRLQNCVTFTGALDGAGMREEYLHSNVFVCPSAIENSPNSLAEAQILGVPVIASYVGGVPDMMKGDEEHLYRFEEVEMLAFKICELFAKGGNIDTEPMRLEALRRHDPEKNARELMSIYQDIVQSR